MNRILVVKEIETSNVIGYVRHIDEFRLWLMRTNRDRIKNNDVVYSAEEFELLETVLLN